MTELIVNNRPQGRSRSFRVACLAAGVSVKKCNDLPGIGQGGCQGRPVALCYRGTQGRHPMARFTDLIAELTAAAADIARSCEYACYAHREPGLLSMAARYGVRYTLAEVAACRDL